MSIEEKPTTPKKPRKKRQINPLKKKSKKLTRVKNLDEISINKKASRGSELIQMLNDIKDGSINIKPDKEAKTSLKDSSDQYVGSIKNGVEVVDVKAIPDKKKV